MSLESLIRKQMGVDMKIVTPSEFDYEPQNGRLLIYQPPVAGAVYCLGVDPAEGVQADNSVCQVIRMGDIKRPSEQVAEFACNFLDPVDFASVVDTIGRLYSGPDGEEAFLTLEINAPCGDNMMTELRMRLDYSNLYIRKNLDKITGLYTNTYGWSTNKSSRPKIIARGLHAMTYGDLVINSPYLLDEMTDFRRDQFDEKPEARSNRHDDRLMALLIGYYGGHEDEWLMGEDLGEQRRARKHIVEYMSTVDIAEEPVKILSRGTYQNRPISTRQMSIEVDSWLFDEDQ